MLSLDEWILWTRGKPDARRDFGIPRRPVDGWAGVQAGWRGIDEYASVFSSEQVEKGEFDTIFFDIDAHNGEDWREKAGEVLRRFEFPPSRVYATGRGAHVYLDLEEPIKGMGRYKQVVAALVKKWRLDGWIDSKVVGDVRRMARLPGSKNSKGGYAVRIAADNLGIAIMGEPETLTVEQPRRIALVLGEATAVEPLFISDVHPKIKRLYEDGQQPPCVRIGLKQLMETGELDHAERLHVFSWLVLNGDKALAYEYLKQYAGDFNAGISTYQLNRMEQVGHKPFKCTNVPRDLCPYQNQRDCNFWPSVNLHRERLLASQAK